MKISCIIPAYGRDVQVIEETLSSLFKLGDEFFKNCIEVWLIDQNISPLKISAFIEKWNHQISYIPLCSYCTTLQFPSVINENSKVNFYHVTGLTPSTTRAKNWAISRAVGELLCFYDDDVTVLPGNIINRLKFHKSIEELGFLGGREIIDPPTHGRKKWKSLLITMLEKGKFTQNDRNFYTYLHPITKKAVGFISDKGLFYCNFDQEGTGEAIQVDTIRGCNASLKKSIWSQVGGFDERFQKSALREESDLSLRIKMAGYKNYYIGEAVAIHRRQIGGCNNLVKSYSSLISKYECELLFQLKHFKDVSPLYFFLRLFPLALESIRYTWGLSFLLLVQFTSKFHLERKR